MKKGWEYKELGEVAKICGGKRLPKGCKLQSEPTKHKYIRVADFLDNGTVCKDDIQYISDDIFNQIKRYTISSADVYISIAGTIGKSGIVPDELNGANLTENACKLVLNKELYKRFVYLVTISPFFKEQINTLTKKSAQPKLALTRLATVNVPVPPLSEQKEIVEYLDSSFAKIDKLKENAAKNLEEAKALFQSALKDALEPKEGWEEKTMDEIVDINTPISYGIVQPGDDVPNGIPVVRPVDLTAKNISLNENIKRTAKENSESYKRTILNGKEILMCVRGTTGIVSLTDVTLKNCNVTRGIVPLKITDETLRLFVYYTIIAPIVSGYIQHNTRGAALKQINIADVKKIPVALPSPQEQQSIVSFLDSLNEKVNTLQQNYSRICDECDALKQAILRQVFE